MWLSKPVKVTNNNKTSANCATCPFLLHYNSVMFYSIGPWMNAIKFFSLSVIFSQNKLERFYL